MYSFSKVLVLLACLAAIASGSPNLTLGESKLLKAMRSTRDLQQSNPSRSLECFEYYSGLIDQLLQKYEQEFQRCQNTSQLKITLLDDSFKPVLSNLSNNAKSACQLMDNCNSQMNSLQSLACFSDVGTGDAKVMYNISITANLHYGQLRQRIEMIQFTEDQCTNRSKLNYELESDQAYVSLQSCLMGNDPVATSSSTTSTTTTAIYSKTTEAVTTTPVSVAATTTAVDQVTSSSAKTSLDPRMTTSALVAFTPTTSAAPRLSSNLKKLLNSLKH